MFVAVGEVEISLGAAFIKETNSLEPIEIKRVWDAVEKFQNDPDHPSLNCHPISADRAGRLHTFRASKELRVLVAREGSVDVIVESGHQDAIYEHATRSRFIASPSMGFVGWADPGAAAPRGSSAKTHNHAGTRQLGQWTDA